MERGFNLFERLFQRIPRLGEKQICVCTFPATLEIVAAEEAGTRSSPGELKLAVT